MTFIASMDDLLATDALALFLGDPPFKVICLSDGTSRTLAEPAPQSTGPELSPVGSILVLEGPGPAGTRNELARVLAGCYRTLKPDGRIAVLVDSRLHRRIAGLRALLRRVAGRGAADGGRNPGLRLGVVLEAVGAAGFCDLRTFAVTPSADDPEIIRPLGQGDGWRAAAFLVTASKSAGTGPSQLETLVQPVARSGLADAAAEPAQLLQVTNSGRGKSVALMECGSTRIVIRIARSDVMREDEGRSYRLLQAMESNPQLRGRVPRPLMESGIGEMRAFAQSHLDGVPLSATIGPSNRASYLAQVNEFLRALNPDLPTRAATSVRNVQGAAVGQPMIPFVLQHIDDADLRARASRFIDDALRTAVCRLGIVHGDFGTPNILVTGGRITGVIDWEAARDGAPPVLDAINYLDAAHRTSNAGLSIVDTLPLLADGQWPVTGEMEFLSEFFKYCGADFGCLREFVLLYLIFHIGPQLRFVAADQGPRRRLEQALRKLLPP